MMSRTQESEVISVQWDKTPCSLPLTGVTWSVGGKIVIVLQCNHFGGCTFAPASTVAIFEPFPVITQRGQLWLLLPGKGSGFFGGSDFHPATVLCATKGDMGRWCL